MECNLENTSCVSLEASDHRHGYSSFAHNPVAQADRGYVLIFGDAEILHIQNRHQAITETHH